MNYLEADSRTGSYLKRWAGTSQLIVGSFYFWYAGNELQKSQTGLIRSILLSVLSNKPELCVPLFPDICRTIFSGHLKGQSLEFTTSELTAAFSKLISLSAEMLNNAKIMFIVDGLDEYSGNHNDICELFSQIEGSPSIKVLLSSRPIPVCVERFREFPKLRLEDLTWNDIKKYTEDRL